MRPRRRIRAEVSLLRPRNCPHEIHVCKTHLGKPLGLRLLCRRQSGPQPGTPHRGGVPPLSGPYVLVQYELAHALLHGPFRAAGEQEVEPSGCVGPGMPPGVDLYAQPEQSRLVRMVAFSAVQSSCTMAGSCLDRSWRSLLSLCT